MNEFAEHILEWREFKRRWEEHLLTDKKYKAEALAEEVRQAECIKQLEPLITSVAVLTSELENQKEQCTEHRAEQRQNKTEERKAQRDWVSIIMKLTLGAASFIIALAGLLFVILKFIQNMR